MDNKQNKQIENIEKVERVTKSLDKGVEMAHEKLAEVPSLMGSHKSKVTVALTLLLIFAVVRDQSLALIGAVILLVLYSSKIVGAIKQKAIENDIKKQSKEVVTQDTEKKDQ